MRAMVSVLAVVVLGACASSRAMPSRGAATDSAAVVAAVLAHRTAIAGGDVAAVDRQHLPDLTFFGPESPHLVDLSSKSPETAALLKVFAGARAKWEPRGVQVKLFGDIAVALFFIEGSITYANGTRDVRPRHVTEVWVREPDGTWKESHHHESPVP